MTGEGRRGTRFHSNETQTDASMVGNTMTHASRFMSMGLSVPAASPVLPTWDCRQETAHHKSQPLGIQRMAGAFAQREIVYLWNFDARRIGIAYQDGGLGWRIRIADQAGESGGSY